MLENMGAKIKNRRLELKMTLTELGDKVGVGASTVRKWENGIIKDMRSDKIQKVADALGVSPSFLMDWAETHAVGTVIPHINMRALEGLNKEEIELIRIYRLLSVKRRLSLMNTVLTLEQEQEESST